MALIVRINPIYFKSSDGKRQATVDSIIFRERWKIAVVNIPPMFALNATPTQQFELLAWAATSPAHMVPWLGGWMDERVDRWINGWMDERMDGWIDG